MTAPLNHTQDHRLLFCGDTHGPLTDIIECASKHPDHHLIHVGDLSPVGGPLQSVLPEALHQRFWFIPGNHDFDRDEYVDQIVESDLASRNLHGRVVEIDGIRVAGLGGNFLGRVWNPKTTGTQYDTREEALKQLSKSNRWRDGLPRRMRAGIFPEDYKALTQMRADILVTHEAPSSHRCGFAVIDDLARAMGCTLIVHGHHHVDYTATLSNGIQVMGVGLRGVRDITGRIIKPGEQYPPRAESSRTRMT